MMNSNMKNLYKMQMESQAEKEATRSPYINDFIKLVDEIKEGSKTEDDYNYAASSLVEFFGNVKNAADYLKQTQPPSDDFEEKYARLMEIIDLIDEEIGKVGAYFTDGDEESLNAPVEAMKTLTAELFDITDSLRKTEEAQPVYAGSIEINEMIRVGKGYCDGTFSFDAFVGRYEIASRLIEESAAQMKALADQPADTKALEESMPDILKNMDEMAAASERIGAEIAKGDGGVDKAVVLEGLDVVMRTAGAISDIQRKIAEELERIKEEASKRVCPKCGAKTSIYESHCEKCGMLLPPLPEGFVQTQSSLDVVAGADGNLNGQMPTAQQGGENGERLVTPNVAKIYDVALEVGNGRAPKEELGKAIDWYGVLVLKAKEDLGKITEPANLSEEEKTVFNQAYNLFSEGVTGSEAGLNELAEYFTDENAEHLVNGVNMLIEAGEKMYQIEAMGNILQQRIANGGAPINPPAQQAAPSEQAQEEPVDPMLA